MTELQSRAGWGPEPDTGGSSATSAASVPAPRRQTAEAEEWRFSRSSQVLWRHNGQAVVCLMPHSGGVLTLHGAGALLWDLLSQPRTAADLVHRLASVFSVGVETVRLDLDPVLNRLVDLEVVDSVPAA